MIQNLKRKFRTFSKFQNLHEHNFLKQFENFSFPQFLFLLPFLLLSFIIVEFVVFFVIMLGGRVC